ncbi:MAG: DUF5110 domain-containing protein [Sedimentisphaerales bacterium]|nr:DUF5110 domain-containing protein [Sedimentisphaerales bacterium]
MFKRKCGILMTTLLAGTASAGLLFQDDFNSLTGHEPGKAKLQTGSLDYKFQSETGNRVWVKDYDGGVRYKLSPAIIDQSVNPVLYVSFTLRSLNDSVKDKYAGLMFYDNGREVFGLGNDFSSDNFAFWGDNQQYYSIGEIRTKVDREVHKIVARIEFDPAGPEKITVGIDPFCNRSEERQPSNIWSSYQMELKFDELRFRCGNDNCNWEFDDLKIGTDWSSVTPSDNNPGSDYVVYTANALPQGNSEMIADSIARFWPAGVSPSDTLPSLALQSERPAVGAVAGNWQLRPQFGTYGGKRYAYLSIPAEVDLYGTGEVTGGLMRNGTKIRLHGLDNGAYSDHERLYQSHPWVIGVREDGTAFGVLFDTTWLAELNLRSGILFTVPDHAPYFPVIVVEGVNPQSVMAQLGDLIGTMPMAPRWAIGYQQCRFSYVPDARAREVADTFRAKNIPCDVIWFDIDYMDGFRVFTFDAGRYPDPKATNNYLHSKGFKGIWMIDPGVKKEEGYFVYDSGTAADVWVKTASGEQFYGPVWPGDSVFPDFTSPAVRNWWAGLFEDFMAYDIDGVWNDMNEPTVFGLPDMTMPMDNQFRGGDGLLPGTHEQYHNAYGMLMTKASRQGIQAANPDKRPFVLTRSNYLGGQRYAATWTGDNASNWEHLKWSVPMSLNLGLSGQPFSGADIGGFLNNATPELFGHWITLGAFYPFSRAHSCAGTADHEPWSFGTEVEDASRRGLERRYRLMPYLYTLFEESTNSGIPVMQPVFFADPADKSLRGEEEAFLLGSDLMAIPQWAQNVSEPQGIWQEIILPGEQVNADPYQLILKQRGGSILPLGPVVQSTAAIPALQKLTLNIVLDEQGKASGRLYEDAGDGYEYKQGQYLVSDFSAERIGDKVVVKCVSQEGQMAVSSRMVSVVVVDQQGTYFGYGDICGSDGVEVKLTLSAGWQGQDIGSVRAAGGAASEVSEFTVTGSGADIEGGADEFQFVSKILSGDCEITAQVISQQNTNDWAKAGVMIREDLTPGSAHAMMVLTPSNGIAFQRRTVSGASGTLHTGIGGKVAPYWVRVKRLGDQLTGYYSADGVNWSIAGTERIVMGSRVYVGLAVTSHDAGLLSTVNFNGVDAEMAAVSVDRNGDGEVDISDFMYVAADWGVNGEMVTGDITGDQMVDMGDMVQVLKNWLN